MTREKMPESAPAGAEFIHHDRGNSTEESHHEDDDETIS
jgi:hypothetical protein